MFVSNLEWDCWSGRLVGHTSFPMTPPTNSFAEPAVWFQEPLLRLGSSRVTAPEETVAPGTLTAE